MKDLQFIAFILSIHHYLIPPPIPNSSLLCPFFCSLGTTFKSCMSCKRRSFYCLRSSASPAWRKRTGSPSNEHPSMATQRRSRHSHSKNYPLLYQSRRRRWGGNVAGNEGKAVLRGSGMMWWVGRELRDRLFGMIGQEIAPRFDWVVENN